MSDYELYYWSVPFRGQFVRAVMAFAGKTWTEGGDAAIAKLMGGPLKTMPAPFMGPPILIDKKADFAIAQMPAVVLYLGETLNLMPATPALRAMTIKIVNDANDVIDEITLDGGRQMWTVRWREFVPRLKKRMPAWGGDRPPPRPDGGLRLFAGRRSAGPRRHRDSDAVVDHDRALPQDRDSAWQDRAHDGRLDAADRRPAAVGQAGRQGAARLWRGLLRWENRSVAAQGPGLPESRKFAFSAKGRARGRRWIYATAPAPRPLERLRRSTTFDELSNVSSFAGDAAWRLAANERLADDERGLRLRARRTRSLRRADRLRRLAIATIAARAAPI